MFYFKAVGMDTRPTVHKLLYTIEETLLLCKIQLPEMAFENDYTNETIIRMHLPGTMFESMAHMLRNESSIMVYFAASKGFFGTGGETTGE